MNKQRIDGVVNQAKGSIKEAIGKITGDKQTELEGKAEKTLGKGQAAVGKAQDKLTDKASK